MAGQQSSDEGLLVFLFIVFILGGMIFLIWYLFGDQLMALLKHWRYAQMFLIVQLMGDNYSYLDPVTRENFFYRDVMNWMATVSGAELSAQHQGLFTRMVMNFYKWPIVVLMAMMFIWTIFRGPGTRFKRILNLEGLIFEQSKTFPVIKPFIKFNPLKQPPRVPGTPVPAELPPFAEALAPEEWIAFNRIPMPNGNLDLNITKHAFVKQLGRRWGGIASLKDHEKALFAAFALKSMRQRKEADELLNELALCWSLEKGLRLKSQLKRRVNAILKNAKISKNVYFYANHHAYTKTALLRALQYAREEGGVLASAQFVWLRAYDRELWYPLNNLGRRSYHAEAMGVMAHFAAEKSMGRPIPVPQIDSAVQSLQTYLKDHDSVVIPKLDYKESKKRSGILKPSSKGVSS